MIRRPPCGKTQILRFRKKFGGPHYQADTSSAIFLFAYVSFTPRSVSDYFTSFIELRGSQWARIWRISQLSYIEVSVQVCKYRTFQLHFCLYVSNSLYVPTSRVHLIYLFVNNCFLIFINFFSPKIIVYLHVSYRLNSKSVLFLPLENGCQGSCSELEKEELQNRFCFCSSPIAHI